MIQDAVDLIQMHAELLQLRFLRPVHRVGRGDLQSEHQRGDGRNDAHHELDDFLGVAVQVVLGQAVLDVHCRERRAESARARQYRNHH